MKDISVSKKGEISFEGILIMAFALVLVVAVAATVVFYQNHASGSINDGISTTYNKILTSIRLDTHHAVIAAVASGSVTLLDKNADQISKYEIKDNNFVRFDSKNENMTVLFEKVEAVGFSFDEKLPNLLTVRIFPADKQLIPFFTSFALRGLNDDMQ